MILKKHDVIYVDDLGERSGSVQMYARPAVIIQNNMGNYYSPNVIVAFITGKEKRSDLPTHVVLEGYNLPKKSTVLLEQITTISKTDITSKIGSLRKEDREKVDRAILISLGLTGEGSRYEQI